MRLFYLEDQKGERFPLNNETGVFLYHPNGLGIEYSNDYGESGSGFYLRVKDGISQSEIGFTLVFPPSTDSPYVRYRKFIDWIYAAEELYLIYCPYGSYEYYRHIEFHSIEKTEIQQDGSLQSAASVLPLTPWYLPSPINIDFSGDQENIMRYEYYYTDDLIYGVSSTDYTASIESRGHMPSAVKVTFKGEVINPKLTLRGVVTRNEIGVCEITETFSQGDTLVFCSAEQDSYVKKIDSEGHETDLLDKIDITSNPFFRVPLSEPCELSITGTGIYGQASMVQYVYYRGV